MVFSASPDRSSLAGTHRTGLGQKRRLAPASWMAPGRSPLSRAALNGAQKASCVQARSKSSPYSLRELASQRRAPRDRKAAHQHARPPLEPASSHGGMRS